MSGPEGDKIFAGSIPKLYDELLVPLIFEPYADDIASRLASRKVSRVLEIAAGTGVVTRRLASALPADVAIVATDLNRPMLDMAAEVGTTRPVEWREADAMQLPFADGEFDAVVCQFGVMFFPDKAKAFSEARRVLKPGGTFLFNVWDRIEENEFADTVTTGARLHSFPAIRRASWRARRTATTTSRPSRATSQIGGFAASPARRHGRRAKHGRVAANSRACVLPGNAAAQRNRGARQIAARSRRPTSRRQASPGASDAGAGQRQDPGARRRRRAMTNQTGSRP